jgi:hypothetical protein
MSLAPAIISGNQASESYVVAAAKRAGGPRVISHHETFTQAKVAVWRLLDENCESIHIIKMPEHRVIYDHELGIDLTQEPEILSISEGRSRNSLLAC